MSLPPQVLLGIGLIAGLFLFHMIHQMIRSRSLADFQLFIFMALFTALYCLEILYLQLPLVDVILVIALGVTGGLYIMGFLRFKK